MFDLIIIGGGPGGVAAGVYAARKRLKTLLVTETIGGQSTESFGIENWIGTEKIAGTDLAKKFATHLESAKSDVLEIKTGSRVTTLTKASEGFEVKTSEGVYTTRAVLVASGAGRRKLDVPGADKFENKGVTYCASCDGPLFSGMDVAVVGGGNAGFETAIQLLAYAKSVTLLHRHKDFKADAVTVEKVLAHPNMKVLRHVEPIEVLGEQFVTGLKYKDKDTGEEAVLPVSGIFAELGVLPNTDFAAGLLELDIVKRIKVDPKNQRTGVEGIWAAGDCTDELYHQNNIAAGDGVKALEDIYLWLKMR
jgi:alkyl hydroperoxide reductase subunit F